MKKIVYSVCDNGITFKVENKLRFISWQDIYDNSKDVEYSLFKPDKVIVRKLPKDNPLIIKKTINRR